MKKNLSRMLCLSLLVGALLGAQAGESLAARKAPGSAKRQAKAVARGQSDQAAGQADFWSQTSGQEEEHERNVDEAALSAQKSAEAYLSEMARKARGTSEEPGFLFKLAEIQQQAAGMQFRVAYGQAVRASKARQGQAGVESFKRDLSNSVATLTRLISAYPKFEEISLAYFMRARAQEELEQKAGATRDYLHLVRHYPNAEEVGSSYMSLAEFAMEDNKYQLAIDYLRNVERRPEAVHYPFALYKMAWSYHNLRKVPEALGYAQRLVRYYGSRAKLTSSDVALRENVIKDIPMFYYEGFERKLPGYGVQDAFAYFRKLQPSGPAFGQMITLYAKLLRSHERSRELVQWKQMMLAYQAQSSESAELVLSTYEAQLGANSYPEMVATSRDVVRVLQARAARATKETQAEIDEQRARGEKLLFDSAALLQGLVIKEKDPERAQAYGIYLASVYQAFTQLVDPKDARVRTVHANLAETLFAIKKYDDATSNYRWIVANGNWSENAKTPKSVTGGITTPEASLKAIAARYESLRERKLVPGELKAVALSKNRPSAAKPMIGEWVGWIDTHVSETDQSIDNFQFEANRCLYANGQMGQAVERLRAFALKYPKSSFAIPSATLVVDTYIASSQWVELAQMTREFMSVDAWKGSPFSKKLYKIAADANFKHAEQLAASRDYKAAVEQADQLASNYGSSEHVTNSLALAGNSALAMKDRKLALEYFSKLVAASPRSETAAKAYLAMAKIEEDRYGFSAAARHYRSYISLPVKVTKLDRSKLDDLRSRILTLAWLGGDFSQLRPYLADRGMCTAAQRSECERYRALLPIMGGRIDARSTRQAAVNAGRASAETRSIWAATALENADRLSFAERHRMISILASNWGKVDPLAKFTLLPKISVSVPQAYALDRDYVRRAVKLKADERSITARLKLAQQAEQSALEAAKLPWSRIRALVLNEIAWMYADYSMGLRELPFPKGLNAAEHRAYESMVSRMVQPFEKKARELRSKAYEIASRNWIETDALNRVAQALYQGSGREPKEFDSGKIELGLVTSLDDESWSGADADSDSQAKVLRTRWAEAIEDGKWQQVGFFVQESRQKPFLSAEVAGAARAVSLAAAGAQAEGRMELADLCRGRTRSKMGSHCQGGRPVL